MCAQSRRAFTVVELLVVVAIIALLVGILLPAIGKARDGALTSQSQSNLRQIAAAMQTYAGEYGDRQFTLVNDYMSQYGGGNPNPDGVAVCAAYIAANGLPHPPVVIGYVTNPGNPGVMATYQFAFGGPGATDGNCRFAVRWSAPMNFVDGSATGSGALQGAFRFVNTRPLSAYLNGRFYDPVYYAPKDRAAMASVEKHFDRPEEAIYEFYTWGSFSGQNSLFYWSSYCLSPAAMWNPVVLSEQHGASNPATAPLYNNPWLQPAGFKSPGMSQARYANIKTMVLEHQWLQNNKRSVCNPVWTGGTYDGCEPWYYNASILSNPMAAFYDGHVGAVGVRDAMDSNQRVLAQHGQNLAGGTRGLWSNSTPLGGFYEPPVGVPPQAGYWQNAWAGDGAATSFHMLTSYGIKGRDIIPK